MRNALRSTLLAGLTGSMVVAAAWAGVGLAPGPRPTPPALPSLPGATAVPGRDRKSAA